MKKYLQKHWIASFALIGMGGAVIIILLLLFMFGYFSINKPAGVTALIAAGWAGFVYFLLRPKQN